MITALYPGTFDPITNGHIEVINRSLKIFDKVIVAIAHNSRKTPLFSIDERKEMIRKCINNSTKLVVDHFEGLTVDYARKNNVQVIVRGLRAVSDFEAEFQMVLTNQKLASEIQTIFMMPSEKYIYLSSSLVKEIAYNNGDITGFVSEEIKEMVIKRVKEKYFCTLTAKVVC